jgi:hypothetical protein
MKRLLPLILIFLCSAALAESGAYRVEVIIFRNLAVTAEAIESEELRSFSHFPDLQEPVPVIGVSDEPVKDPVAVIPEKLPGETPEPRRDDLPDDLHVVAQKGPAVDDAWRRLRSSRDYRPLLYEAWEQNRTDYYPPMRVHNQQIIDTRLHPPTAIMVADLTMDDPLAAYRSTFYQLDGSVQLRRSRFLHLFLDLEYREEPPQVVSNPGFLSGNTPGTETVTGIESSTDHRVFGLKQNRQIRTGQMQYFDTPYFGALVLVTALKAE